MEVLGVGRWTCVDIRSSLISRNDRLQVVRDPVQNYGGEAPEEGILTATYNLATCPHG